MGLFPASLQFLLSYIGSTFLLSPRTGWSMFWLSISLQLASSGLYIWNLLLGSMPHIPGQQTCWFYPQFWPLAHPLPTQVLRSFIFQGFRDLLYRVMNHAFYPCSSASSSWWEWDANWTSTLNHYHPCAKARLKLLAWFSQVLYQNTLELLLFLLWLVISNINIDIDKAIFIFCNKIYII